MTELDLLFYILGTLSVLGGLGVVLTKSPINSVLYLVMTMLAVAGLRGRPLRLKEEGLAGKPY